MRHAREDYQRIQDPAGLIPENEPVFLFRAQDKFTSTILTIYANLVEAASGDPELVTRVRNHVVLIDAWPKKKLPDLAEKGRDVT